MSITSFYVSMICEHPSTLTQTTHSYINNEQIFGLNSQNSEVAADLDLDLGSIKCWQYK